ncbi:MAG TPA: glycosyltransferase family 2 protein [Nitriliruptorales bacterium]
MPLASIVTPTQAHNADHLPAAWQSLRDAALPAGWELEWLVQEDGAAPRLRGVVPVDPRVRYDALGVQAGGPTTRNLALARAVGDIVLGLDHDDEVVPGGPAALLHALTTDREAVWACGRAELLLQGGQTWVKPDVFPPGRLEAGAVSAWYSAHNDFPFPAAFTAYRREHLVAIGGWPAVVRSADAVLLAAVNDRWPGRWVDRIVARYRRWPAQASVQPDDIRIRDLPHVRGVITQRAAAVERIFSSSDGAPPTMSSRRD